MKHSSSENKKEDNTNVLNDEGLCCPISGELMIDAVKLCVSGVTYSLNGLNELLDAQRKDRPGCTSITCPVTRIDCPLKGGGLDVTIDKEKRAEVLRFIEQRNNAIQSKEQMQMELRRRHESYQNLKNQLIQFKKRGAKKNNDDKELLTDTEAKHHPNISLVEIRLKNQNHKNIIDNESEIQKQLNFYEKAVKELNSLLSTYRSSVGQYDQSVMNRINQSLPQNQHSEYNAIAAVDQMIRLGETNTEEASRQIQTIKALIAEDKISEVTPLLNGFKSFISTPANQIPEMKKRQFFFDYYCAQAQIALLNNQVRLAITSIGSDEDKTRVGIENITQSATYYRSFCLPIVVDIEHFTPGDKESDLRIANFRLIKGRIKLFQNISGDNSILQLKEAVCIFSYYQDPSLIEAHILLGLAYLKNKNYAEVIKQIKAAFDSIDKLHVQNYDPLLDVLAGEIQRLCHANQTQAKHHYEKAMQGIDTQKKRGRLENHFILAEILARNGLASLLCDKKKDEKQNTNLVKQEQSVEEKRPEAQAPSKDELHKHRDEIILHFSQLIGYFQNDQSMGTYILKNFCEHNYALNLWACIQRGSAFFAKKQYIEAYADFNGVFSDRGLNSTSDEGRIEYLKKSPAIMHTIFVQRELILIENPDLFEKSKTERIKHLNASISQVNFFIDNKVPTDSKSAVNNALRARAAAHLELGNPEKALADCVRLEDRTKNQSQNKSQNHEVNSIVFAYRARAHYQLHQYTEAINECVNTLTCKGNIATDRKKLFAAQTACMVFHARLLEDKGVEKDKGIIEEVVKHSQKLIQTLKVGWPQKQQQELCQQQCYRDACAYLFIAHLKLADKKIAGSEQYHFDRALEEYIHLCTLSEPKVLDSHQLAHHYLLDFCKALSRTSFLNSLKKIHDVICKHKPALEVSVTKYCFEAACYTGQWSDAKMFFLSTHRCECHE